VRGKQETLCVTHSFGTYLVGLPFVEGGVCRLEIPVPDCSNPTGEGQLYVNCRMPESYPFTWRNDREHRMIAKNQIRI